MQPLPRLRKRDSAGAQIICKHLLLIWNRLSNFGLNLPHEEKVDEIKLHILQEVHEKSKSFVKVERFVFECLNLRVTDRTTDLGKKPKYEVEKLLWVVGSILAFTLDKLNI